jgi:murein DD-endopeptidase MepM/ murein hydrolase activator NlpD
VTRFDFPNLSDNGAPTGALAGAAGPRPAQGFEVAGAAPPRGVGAPDEAAEGYPPARLASARDYAPQTAPLPPLVPEHRPAQPSFAGERRGQAAAAASGLERPATELAPSPQRPAAQGDTIEVGPGDTLYGLAKRYGVSLADLIERNGLHHGASLKPGQQIVLPAGALARQARREARGKPAVELVPVARVPVGASSGEAVRAASQAAPPPAAAAGPAEVASAWQGRHTIKTGESLYGIARQHQVSLAELQRVNGIGNPLQVKVGTTLMVPAAATPAAPGLEARAGGGEAPTPAKIINPPPEKKVVAARSDQVSDAEPAAAASAAGEPSSGRFRWPARGRVIAGYGRRADGTQNDGINLALPQGTEVHASEAGKVAYAGNELKGYGNLILIRHDNGWVSAYAHNDQLLVKRDDLVRRGQVIAKAGKTGAVDQPQLHFELRQGSRPVDPLLHLEKN